MSPGDSGRLWESCAGMRAASKEKRRGSNQVTSGMGTSNPQAEATPLQTSVMLACQSADPVAGQPATTCKSSSMGAPQHWQPEMEPGAAQIVGGGVDQWQGTQHGAEPAI